MFLSNRVFKFPRSPTIKITFDEVEMAKKALVEGLHLFQIHIPGHQMRQEVFIPLLTCNRCNAVEDHATKSCPKPSGYVLCSECGNEDHSFRTCTATSKKCLHCGGEHSTRAMRCPMRKEALKNKEEAARQARVRRLAANYRHPRKFWREIKCLSGCTTGPSTYLLDHTGEKLFTDNDKERLFTNIWDHVYSEDYNNDFDDND